MNNVKGFPPQVFIIGAQKSGTTQLAALLDQHTDICLSSPKEPDFFTRHFNKGLDWYKSCFFDTTKCLIDASTSYSCRPLPNIYPDDVNRQNNPMIGVPQRIHQVSPNARLIYIVRDPIKRTYSSYWHQVRAGIETAPLDSAILKNTYYRRISKYAEQMAYYLEYFDPEQILLLDFEQLIKSPHDEINKCLVFLGLVPLAHIQTDVHKNKSFQYSGLLNILNVKLAKFGGLKPISQIMKRILPDIVVELLKGKMAKPIPQITDAQKKLLASQFDEEVAKVKMLLNNAKQDN